MDLKHEINEDTKRFFLLENSKTIGEIAYSYKEANIIDIHHTEIDKAFRGQNLGEKLINAVAAFARENDLKVVASCPYVVKVFGETDQYDDIKV